MKKYGKYAAITYIIDTLISEKFLHKTRFQYKFEINNIII